MYFVIVIATTIVLPVLSAFIDWTIWDPPLNSFVYPTPWHEFVACLGKWYVFWAGGVRLLLAGLRQTFAPKMTSEQIFEIRDEPRSLHIVQELGFANLSIGLLCLVSPFLEGATLAGAIVAGLFYGLAGLKHATTKGHNAQRFLAMVTDILVFIVLATYVLLTLSARL